MDFLKLRHPFIQLLMLLGLLGAGLIMGGALTYLLLKPITGFNPQDLDTADLKNTAAINAWRLLFAINSVAVFLLPGFVFSKLYDHPALEKAGFRSATVRNLIIATALLIIAIPLINTLSIWNKGIHFPASLKSAEEAFRNMTKEYEQRVSTVINMPDQFTLLLNILVMAVLPAIAEELFFRGCMQQIFQRWLKNSLLAVIVTAVIFSAFHFDFYGFFPRIVLGMILGWLFAKTGSLLPGILAHFMNNAMALLFTYVGQHSPVQKNFATEDLNIPMWTGFISLVAVLFLITRLTRDHCFDYPEKNNFTFENIQ